MTSTYNTAEEAKKAALALIASIKVSDVSSVYSGKPGCCCGCNGNHRYNSQHVESASKNRGYAVTPDEVNDRQVKKILAILQANADVVAENRNNFYAEITTDAGRQRV